MSGLKEKALSVALVAALLFCTFPVSTGVPVLDRGRYEQAHAIAPAIPIIVATACAAAGVCIAGATTTTYDANLDSVYSGLKNGTGHWSSSWAQYCQDKGGFDAAMNSALTVDGQNIDLKVLTDAGFFDSLKSYTAYCLGNGTAVSGSSSSSSRADVMTIGGLDFNVSSDLPGYAGYVESEFNWVLSQNNGYQLAGMIVTDGTTRYVATTTNSVYYINNNGKLAHMRGAIVGGLIDGEPKVWKDNYYVVAFDPVTSVLYSGYDFSGVEDYDGVSEKDPASFVVSGSMADALDGVDVELPSATVQPFEPTAEQLEAGYTSADVIAVEVGEIGQTTGEISEDVASILTGVGGILTALSPLAGILTAVNTISGVVSGVQSSPFSWLQTWWNTLSGWWASLLSMLGDTPLSTLLGPLAGIADIVAALTGQGGVLEWLGNVTVGDLLTGVQSGVGSITGAISSGVTTMVNDVDTWLGTLNGWWEGLGDFLGLGVDGLTLEGLLEGVLSGTIPLTLSGVIEAIQAAVDALTASIDGVLEGVTFPTFPGLDLRPGSGTFDLAVPTNDVFRDFNGQLANKAPFAYLVAINDDFQAINGTYSAVPSFYWEVDTPFVGLVRVDAGPWLNYEVHGTSIAYLLRIAFNSFMIVMLLRLCFKAMQSGLSK